MTQALDGLITFLFVAGIGWSLAFGCSSAALARSQGRAPLLGLALGVVLGPGGWLVLLALDRWGAPPGARRASAEPASRAATSAGRTRPPPRSTYG